MADTKKRITERDILNMAADEARSIKDPVKRAQGLYTLINHYPGDDEKAALAREVVDLLASQSGTEARNMSNDARRHLAGAEIRKLDRLEGDERVAQMDQAIAAARQHPDVSQRVTLLADLAKRADA